MTFSRSPQRVMARNLSASSVSSEMLIRLTPFAFSSAAYFCSCEPLVVSVNSLSAPLARWREREETKVMMPRRTSGSPPVKRNLLTPFCDECAAEPVEFLKAQKIGLRQERHVLRHAVDAAEVAAVGHRHSQVRDGALEWVDQVRRTRPCRGKLNGRCVVHQRHGLFA